MGSTQFVKQQNDLPSYLLIQLIICDAFFVIVVLFFRNEPPTPPSLIVEEDASVSEVTPSAVPIAAGASTTGRNVLKSTSSENAGLHIQAHDALSFSSPSSIAAPEESTTRQENLRRLEEECVVDANEDPAHDQREAEENPNPFEPAHHNVPPNLHRHSVASTSLKVEYNDSLWLLLKIRSFVYLFIGYGINVGAFYAISTLLQQIIEPRFPSANTDVGYEVFLFLKIQLGLQDFQAPGN